MDLEEYQSQQRAKYAAFAETVASILSAALSHEPSLHLQHVQHRGKDPQSLKEKLADRGILDTTTLEAEIKDLAGCRVVFYTNSDVLRFSRLGDRTRQLRH
jgi:ppGpp synthetase/RelA/SpoT-type nucleotidyltranferase